MLEPWEPEGLLPEIFLIGPDTVYEVRYDADGVADGAIRCIDEPTARRWASVIDTLHRRGEQIGAFFHRAVAGSRPAVGESPPA